MSSTTLPGASLAPVAPEPVIETCEVTKRFRHPVLPWRIRAQALCGLSLRVERGEVFGLLGPNGSGKSTTIKLLVGLIFPTSGEARVFGKSPRDIAVKGRIGFLPEESRLYPNLTARETLQFFGKLFPIERRERARRVAALLEFAGLTREADRRVGEFSKGMQRRVALAQALINDPELIILDEPASGMDPIGTAEIKALIRLLKERQKTVLLSSHQLADVEDVCDRITILYGGRAQVTGEVSQLLGRKDALRVLATLGQEDTDALRRWLKERLDARAGHRAGGRTRTRADGDDTVEVAPERERLEPYFLGIVKQAQERDAETSGVRAASLDALRFLSASGGTGG